MDKKEPSFPDNICQGREGPAVPPCLLLDLKQPLLIRSYNGQRFCPAAPTERYSRSDSSSQG